MALAWVHAEVTVPSLDDWEKEWGKNSQHSVQPKLLPWISGCRWCQPHRRIELSNQCAAPSFDGQDFPLMTMVTDEQHRHFTGLLIHLRD
jgi:hypothetical protein